MRVDFQPSNANTVERRLLLTAATDPAPVAGRLRALEGVKWLSSEGNVLTVAYDFTHLDYDTLLRELAELGLQTKETGLQALRCAWYRFSDANARSDGPASKGCCGQQNRRMGESDDGIQQD